MKSKIERQQDMARELDLRMNEEAAENRASDREGRFGVNPYRQPDFAALDARPADLMLAVHRLRWRVGFAANWLEHKASEYSI